MAVNDLGERLSFHQLENQRVNALVLLQPVDGRDIGMIERRQRTRLALEARQPIRVGSKRRRQHLERDVSTQLEIVGAIHLAHTADAK